jgi:hypothetical protein
MVSATPLAPVSRGTLWTARTLHTLVILFMLFDSTLHLLKPAPVVEAFNRLGYPLSASVGIGILELLCLIAYALPATAPLGAVLLTGVLGGAVATHVRAGSPAFEAYIFPAILGLMIWAGLWLRDARLRALLPIRGGD